MAGKYFSNHLISSQVIVIISFFKTVKTLLFGIRSNMKLSQSVTVNNNLIAKGVFSILLLGTINKQISFIKILLSHEDMIDHPDTRESNMMRAEYFGNDGRGDYGVTGNLNLELDVVTLLSSKLLATLLSSTLYREKYK